MGLKHIILLVTIISMLILSGCAQIVETGNLSKNLPQLNENFEIHLANIHTDFGNFDYEFSAVWLMNLLTITDSMISGIEKEENNIRQDMLDFENTTLTYQEMKAASNPNLYSTHNQEIMSEIDAKIDEYQTNKESINNCLSNMQTYREWVILLKEDTKLMEIFDSQYNLMYDYVQSEKYSEAKAKIREIQATLGQTKENAEKRKETGIQTFAPDTLESYSALSDSYNYYVEYLNLLIEEMDDEAELKYTEYLKVYSDAVSMGSDEDASLTDTINEVDTWYQNNIGVCFDLFEAYFLI